MAVIIAGALVAALGLEAFLVPNSIIDGGVVGISIMGAHLLDMPIGFFLFTLNLPFIYLGYKRLGKRFAFASLFGVTILSFATSLLHDSFIITADPILAAVFGGAVVGAGVGIVVRYGGTLDGTEIIAVLADKKSPFSIGEIIMFINFFILSSAGFVFGWDNAMYSLIAYFVAFKVIDATVQGFNESKSIWIISKEYKELGKAIELELGRRVNYINGQSSADIIADGVMLTIITRIEEQKLKAIVKKHDPSAYLVISNVREVMGRNFSRKRRDS